MDFWDFRDSSVVEHKYEQCNADHFGLEGLQKTPSSLALPQSKWRTNFVADLLKRVWMMHKHAWGLPETERATYIVLIEEVA